MLKTPDLAKSASASPHYSLFSHVNPRRVAAPALMNSAGLGFAMN